MANKTVTVGPGKTYSSLNAALATESADLVTNTCILTIECYAFQDTTKADSGAGYTTSEDYYIKVIAIDRHDGKRPTSSAYRLEVSSAWAAALTIQYASYTRVIGLAVKNTNATGSTGIYISNSTLFRLIDTIAYDCPGTQAINIGTSSGPLYGILNNCIAMGSVVGFEISEGQMAAYNCVAVNCSSYGFKGDYSGRYFYAKNCYAGGCGTDYYGTNFYFTTSYSEDGSQSTPTAAFSTTSGCYFTNVTSGSEDLSIGSSSVLKDAGTDLGADSYWVHPDGEVDIVGNTRGADAWDVGAFEYVTGGAGPLSVQVYEVKPPPPT